MRRAPSRPAARPASALAVVMLAAATAAGPSRAEAAAPAYEVDFRLAGEVLHMQSVDPPVSMPPGFRTVDRLTDNPLVHGAFWTALDVTARSEHATLTTTLLGEHRGASSGPYPDAEIKVLPSFRLVVERPLLADDGLRVGVETGKLADYRPYCGLLVGNMELDVFRAHLRRGPWRLAVSNIADLSVGLDLGIDDGRDYILSLEDVDAGRGCRIDLRAGRFDYDDSYRMQVDPDEPARTGTTLAAVLRAGGGLGVEGEFSRRDRGDGAGVPAARNAWLARARWSTGDDRAWLRASVEHRSYDEAFNDGFHNANRYVYRYHQVYPLRNYHRPFAQWPVFATYQGRDVRTWIVGADARVPLRGELALAGRLDLNRIAADGAEVFTYPFYDLGLAWAAAPGLELMVTATNRGLNLDEGHQTLYLLDVPVALLAARWAYAW